MATPPKSPPPSPPEGTSEEQKTLSPPCKKKHTEKVDKVARPNLEEIPDRVKDVSEEEKEREEELPPPPRSITFEKISTLLGRITGNSPPVSTKPTPVASAGCSPPRTASSSKPSPSPSIEDTSLTPFQKVTSAVLSVLPKKEEKTEEELERERKAKEQEMYIGRPAICLKAVKELDKFCLSLSGCGFLGSYHFGAMACFIKNGQHVLSRLERVSGASAGSLVASLLVLAPNKLNLGLERLYLMADELNLLKFGALTPGYFLNENLIRIVDQYIPENIEPAQGKLYISLTDHKSRQNVLVNSYGSRAELIDCLLASCYIPMYSMGYDALPPVINGTAYIDGGYSNNLPDFEEIRTVTISPFSGSAEISPSDQSLFDWRMTLCNQQMKVNMHNIVRGAQALFPPSRAVLENYFQMGYKDTFKFLLKHDLVVRPTGTPV